MTGMIIKALAGFYYVKDGNEVVQCRARGKFRKESQKPLVGDYVEYKKEGSEGYIMKIRKRENFLIRPPIANVDQAILVFSCKEPEFDSALLDKFLMLIEYENIDPIIVISKMDLNDGSIDRYIEYYRKAGYTVFPVSAKLNQGIEELKLIFKDKLSVFTGQSGVGKSSLLNALDIELKLDTNEISKALGRGKHTTRHVELMEMYDGYVGDTPGFSSLSLTMKKEDAALSYREFRRIGLDCKYRGCLHLKEPHCAVKEAVENGDIIKERYDHYVANMEEVKKNEEKQYG